LANFFFREQAYSTLEALIYNAELHASSVLDILDEATEDMDIDEVEEMFYSYSYNDCADNFGIELEEEEEEEEEEED
jgi:hypothetical protein